MVCDATVTKIILLGIAYIVMISQISAITKINETVFDYAPLSITVFFINLMFPINILLYHLKYGIRSLTTINRRSMYLILFCSLLYAIETSALYWALEYIPLGFYIIGRTSVVFTDILFYKCIIPVTVTAYLYLGAFLLLISYILNIYGYQDETDYTTNIIVSIVVVFGSGITSSIINNVTKYTTRDTDIEKKQYRLMIHLLTNVCGFCLALPIAAVFAIKNEEFTREPGPIILYLITGTFYQLFTLPRTYILGSKKVNGNKVVTFLDIFRRIATIVIGMLWLGDPFNYWILGSVILLVFGCTSIFWDIKNQQPRPPPPLDIDMR